MLPTNGSNFKERNGRKKERRVGHIIACSFTGLYPAWTRRLNCVEMHLMIVIMENRATGNMSFCMSRYIAHIESETCISLVVAWSLFSILLLGTGGVTWRVGGYWNPPLHPRRGGALVDHFIQLSPHKLVATYGDISLPFLFGRSGSLHRCRCESLGLVYVLFPRESSPVGNSTSGREEGGDRREGGASFCVSWLSHLWLRLLSWLEHRGCTQAVMKLGDLLKVEAFCSKKKRRKKKRKENMAFLWGVREWKKTCEVLFPLRKFVLSFFCWSLPCLKRKKEKKTPLL